MRETGPRPVRTARGAGLILLDGARLDDRALVRALRDREPKREDLLPREAAVDPDVLLLRDPGGEDVRVAMVQT